MTDEYSNDSNDNEGLAAIAVEDKLFKLRKKLDEDLTTELENLDEQGLRQRIAQSECAIHESDRARETDSELNSTIEALKEMKAPYAEVKTTQKNIIKYSTCLLEKMGVI